jgi:multidrug transporter EmrE-like cation transporter
MQGIYFVLISVLFNVAGQFSLKIAMNKFGAIEINNSIITVFSKIIIHPNVILGFTFYIISAISWIIALSKLELSHAYPMLSIGYVLVMFISYFFLNESLGLHKILGTLLIIAGIFLISR